MHCEMSDALNNWMNGLLDYWIIGWFARESAPIHSSIHPFIQQSIAPPR
jgi:hypothetical protein